MTRFKKNNMNNTEENKDMEKEIKTDTGSGENVNSELNDVKNTENGNALTEENESMEVQKLKEDIEKMTKDIETLTDTMKRRQADFENYKKRMIKTQEEQKKFAIRDLALEIININDDLLRACEASNSIDKSKPVEEICGSFSEGFSMISKKVEEALKKFGIEEIDSLNQAFDPNCNEAIEMEDSEDVKCDTITKVHQKGFRMDDLVVRSAKVKVSKLKKQGTNDKKEDGDNTTN